MSRGYTNIGQGMKAAEDVLTMGQRTNDIPASVFKNNIGISDVTSALSTNAEAAEIDNSWRQNETIKK